MKTRHAHQDPRARALLLQELAAEEADMARDYVAMIDERDEDDYPTPKERADFARHACRFQRQSAILYDLARFEYLSFKLATMKRFHHYEVIPVSDQLTHDNEFAQLGALQWAGSVLSHTARMSYSLDHVPGRHGCFCQAYDVPDALSAGIAAEQRDAALVYAVARELYWDIWGGFTP